MGLTVNQKEYIQLIISNAVEIFKVFMACLLSVFVPQHCPETGTTCTLKDNFNNLSMFNEFGPTYKSAKGLSSVPKLTVLVVGTIFPPTSISPPTYIFCPMPTPPTTINDPESVDDAVVSLVIVII